MEIKDIDKNFKLNYIADDKNGMEYYNIPNEKFDLYGVFFDGENGFLRMPLDIASSVSDGVKILCNNTTGGRIRFSTNSDNFEIKVAYDNFCPLKHMPVVGQGGFILIEERQDKTRHIVN